MKRIVVILSIEAKATFYALNAEAPRSKIFRSVSNSIIKKIDIIKMNNQYGSPIAKRLIPTEYVNKYGITNLFHVELANFWRLLYTLKSGEHKDDTIAFVVDILDHNTYNKKFGYRKR